MAHVLLIEPDTILASTYRQALQHAGHTVACVHTAQDAVYEADNSKPDVVVLELQLAAHDGIEFLHEFRSYPEWQRTPVIVNSAMHPAMLAPVRQALEYDLGVTTCLYKPQTTLQQLLRAIALQAAKTV
jgi:CheY-like chemotaxis protein